jgi:hypothetical protein
MSQERIPEEKKGLIHKREPQQPKQREDGSTKALLTGLQKQVGNRAVQRLVQRSGDGSFELDDDTASRINRERGSGQPLDGSVQKQMDSVFGADFSGVQVHNTQESATLNRDLNAQAFTTGSDIFFGEGQYQPQSSGGQELIAHELTHVVQQGSGSVGSSGGMKVNAPGDSFEQEADASAKAALSPASQASVQRDDMPEEEMQAKSLQRQKIPEEDEEAMQAKALQRQEIPEDELQAKLLQRQKNPEDEELQTKALQRQEEDELQPKLLQRQEEDELQPKLLQRQEELPEEEI